MHNIVNIIGVFEMQGKIIGFNEYENSGNIIADDGIQYVFNGNVWVEQQAPKAGDNIDFTFNDSGSINRVFYQTSQSHTNTPPPIHSDLLNNSGQGVPPSLHKPSQDRYAPPLQNSNNHHANNGQNSALDALYAEEENYNIIDWTKKVILNNYANFSGRARRKEYWLFYVGYTILSIIAVIIDLIVGTGDYDLFQSILGLALLVPSLAVSARRLHDTNRSGWWQLLWFIPIIGWIILLIWLATDTSSESNRWGPPARRM